MTRPEPPRRRRSTPPAGGGRHSRPEPRRPEASAAEPAGHTHGHSHEPAPPASERLRRVLGGLLAPFLLAAVAGLVLLWPSGGLPESTIDSGTPVDGTITAVATGPCSKPGEVIVDDGQDQPERRCMTVDVKLAEGAAAGKSIRKVLSVQPGTPRFAADDDIVLLFTGGDPAADQSYQIKDFQRGTSLILIAALFALAVVALGRWQGLRALLGLLITFGVLVLFVLPAILGGSNPLLVAITAAGVIMFVTLYLTHGVSARTSVAVLGTLVSLVLIGLISAAFTALTRLTGIDESTANLLVSLGDGAAAIDTRGLLLAGIVIGALGVLDDVTVTQASAVWELRAANERLTWRELYTSALRIGRDHIASAINTLVLAYAGAALPVFLFTAISGVGLGSIFGSQDIAQEIVRTLAGSIGIIAAVPVTTALAAWAVSKEKMTSATNR